MGNRSPIGHGSRYLRPDFVAEFTPEERARLLLQRLSSECTWNDCRRPRFYDMPICKGHAQIVYGRVKGAMDDGLERARLRSEERPGPEPVVYYLMRGPRTVKIGTTKWLRERVSNLYSELHHVVALEVGGWELEHQRHREFAEERIKRENFHLSERLKAHIETLLPRRDEIMALASRPEGYRTRA